MDKIPIHLSYLKPTKAWDLGIFKAIEEDEVARKAYQHGCDLIVGYFTDHPLTPEQAEQDKAI